MVRHVLIVKKLCAWHPSIRAVLTHWDKSIVKLKCVHSGNLCSKLFEWGECVIF